MLFIVFRAIRSDPYTKFYGETPYKTIQKNSRIDLSPIDSNYLIFNCKFENIKETSIVAYNLATMEYNLIHSYCSFSFCSKCVDISGIIHVVQYRFCAKSCVCIQKDNPAHVCRTSIYDKSMNYVIEASAFRCSPDNKASNVIDLRNGFILLSSVNVSSCYGESTYLLWSYQTKINFSIFSKNIAEKDNFHIKYFLSFEYNTLEENYKDNKRDNKCFLKHESFINCTYESSNFINNERKIKFKAKDGERIIITNCYFSSQISNDDDYTIYNNRDQPNKIDFATVHCSLSRIETAKPFYKLNRFRALRQ